MKGQTRLVGWQWLNGYARRVIKSPSTKFGIRSILRKEERVLEKAGLRVNHEEGMGEEVKAEEELELEMEEEEEVVVADKEDEVKEEDA